jgi:hypothetical protein
VSIRDGPAEAGDDLHNASLEELGPSRRLRCVELARNRVDLLMRCMLAALGSALFESISQLHLDSILFSVLFSLMNELPPVVELDSKVRDGQE